MWKDLVLEAKSLACSRGGRLVFSGLNFAVKGGQCVELRGPNGSGKSSLLRLIAGLNEAAEGSVTDVAEKAHYIGHLEALKSSLTIRDNLAFWSSFMGGAPDLKPFRLEKLADDETRFLSEGQRRRLALSRLVSVKRPVWLLDEPTVGLDQAALAELRRVMVAHLAEGGLILAATHTSLGLPHIRTLELA